MAMQIKLIVVASCCSCCCLHQVTPSYVGQGKIDPPLRPSCQPKTHMRIILTSEKRGPRFSDVRIMGNHISNGLLKRREGCPSERVNPSWRTEDSPAGFTSKISKGQLNARLHSKGQETIGKLTRVGCFLYLTGVFTREKVARVTLARR